MKVEVRGHLGPHEIEIDNPIYGIMLVGNGAVLMANKVTDSKEKAIAYIEKTFRSADAYVVRINGTNA